MEPRRPRRAMDGVAREPYRQTQDEAGTPHLQLRRASTARRAAARVESIDDGRTNVLAAGDKNAGEFRSA